jgi:hypothetical protein
LKRFKPLIDGNLHYVCAVKTCPSVDKACPWFDFQMPLPSYTTAVAADQPLAVFGALGLWWFAKPQEGSLFSDTTFFRG